MKKLLEEVEHSIIRIKKRLVYVEAIEKELQKHAGKARFTVRNDVIYQMIWDSYDMVVIDLASLCRWMKGRGGFFNQLNSHLSKFKRPNPKKIKVRDGVIVEDQSQPSMSQADYNALQQAVKAAAAQRLTDNLNRAYDRLFPPLPPIRRRFPLCWLKPEVIPNNKVTRDHVEALKNRFSDLTEAVVRDRDARRAHRYEKRKADVSVEMLSIGKIKHQFEQVEGIVNDVRALTEGGEYLYNPPLSSTAGIVANDVADMIFLGSIQMVFGKFGIGDELEATGAKRRFYRQFRDDFHAGVRKSVYQRFLAALTRIAEKKEFPPTSIPRTLDSMPSGT